MGIASRKHPRLRGEDLKSHKNSCLNSETPPLTRGRREGVPADRRGQGNTPAYAGKTTVEGGQDVMPWKHPRLRGEDSREIACTMSRQETPPLTRGRLCGSKAPRFRFGNTPAYAGKTALPIEKSRRFPETPPLTRGRRAGARKFLAFVGNTPAYAGKTMEHIAEIAGI